MVGWLLVALGGAIGALLRYGVSGLASHMGLGTPLGTLGVNFTGSLLLGALMTVLDEKTVFGDRTRLFLAVGLFGAFTTMSTFSYESFTLLKDREHLLFALNIAGTLLLCIGGVVLGRLVVLGLLK